MKLAISSDSAYVSAHFGRCPQFTIVDLDNNEIISKEVIDNPGHHPGFLPQFLHEKGVEVIIAGGMGVSAQELFASNQIKTILGVTGKIDDVLLALVNGSLQSGESICRPGAGKGYGVNKSICSQPEKESCDH
ncbi:NifB/NifX family molybdenum-iron cluster-binding protein [Thermoproteota archaeon]